MKRILVIDDAEFILESTSTLLKFEGYDVHTAPDGISGVEKALETSPDLILCDISMPGLDGYGVLEQIRSNTSTSTTPFIFLTAFTEKSNMRAGMEKGADDFIVKPYTRDEIIAAIDAQWNKHSLIEKHVQEKVDEVGRSVTYALPHEFRTALNEIINSAKFLSHDDSINKEEIKEISDDIVHSANRLIKITENFLAYIRIESFMTNPQKRLQLRQFKTDEPSALFSDLATIIAQKKDRTNDLHMAQMVEDVTVEIANESFHKIVDELLDNAFRFSESGEKVIINSWYDSAKLYFTIDDEGRGMTQEQIESIAALAQFERTIYEQQGVGMGLVISKKLVELHDGTFSIKTKSKGTIIEFSLPCIFLGDIENLQRQ